MKQQAYRHGEVLLLKIKELPKDIKPSTSKVFMTGSHGNDHAFDKGIFYPKVDRTTFGYLEAKNTNLLHPEHGDKEGKAEIEDGFYQLIKQQEYTPEGLIPVID